MSDLRTEGNAGEEVLGSIDLSSGRLWPKISGSVRPLSNGAFAMARKSLKCAACGRRFSMPAHLARHVNSVHARRSTSLGPGRGPGRPRSPSAGSAADLVNQMQDYRAGLLARRESIDSEIAAIGNALQAMGTPAPAGRPSRRKRSTERPRRAPGPPLRFHILKALRKQGTPMTPQEIADAVLRAGYRSTAKNMTTSVRAVVSVMAEVKRVDFGRYQL